MNNQEKKRYLKSYGDMNRSINQKLGEYTRVKCMAEKSDKHNNRYAAWWVF